jgi:hypothetical protein
MGDKFVAQIQLGRQACRPSPAEKGLKDWANACVVVVKLEVVGLASEGIFK